ncbi:Ribosome maturation protein SBDS [Intoshia linei]|uniref:Ribosome maturation protein SBDS n=1 Tax=Intoshia linei TaxID=1819745 RepID=A0A177B2J4_9BILA|nr:Ribosome maturation protein SBDS [Intoshia linei]
MSIKAPQNQKRLTNIAIVRYSSDKYGKFEIACYPNKIMAWRNGTEKRLDQVLQCEKIFKNVNKGEFAKNNELKQVFNTCDQQKVCIQILEKGEMQISEKERKVLQDKMHNEIVHNLAYMSIDPITRVPHTFGSIETALKLHKCRIDVNKSSKQQKLKKSREIH